MKVFQKKVISLAAVCALLLSSLPCGLPVAAAEEAAASQPSSDGAATGDTLTYRQYLDNASQAATPGDTIVLDAAQYSDSSDSGMKRQENLDGRSALETTENGTVSWQVSVENEGFYQVSVDYYPVAGKGSSIIRNFYIDGALPFEEARNITFSRCFVNATDIRSDFNGNDVRPTQVEQPRWMTLNLQDNLGYYTEPFRFYFSKGTHTISLESVREPLAIGEMRLTPVTRDGSYEQAKQEYAAKGYQNSSGQYIKVQGEAAVRKSDSMLYPTSDTSSPATEPSSYKANLLNIIGGNKWQTCGQWLEWEVDIPQSGLYKLGVKSRQNLVPGQPTYRKIYIDGQVAFDEMNRVKFPHDTRWDMITVGADEKDPYLFYLEQGQHVVRMECTLGDLAPLAQSVNESITSLNLIYRSFLIVIGQSADTNRDYQFDQVLPEDMAELRNQAEKMEQLYDQFMELSGVGGSQAQILKTLATQARKMVENPETIAKSFSDFSNNISALGTWLTTALTQGLEIDYMVFASPDQKFEKAQANGFKSFLFACQQFASSFFIDYSAIGTSAEGHTDNTLVWISSGKDQANVLQQLIENDFTPNSNIGVTLQLVPAGTLLMATLADKGPDVSLSLSQSDLMNYAIRGAVSDVSEFGDYEEVSKRFQPSASSPLTFNGHVYGLPETQTFPMMFYRTDILKELNLEVPQTWQDVIAMLPVLQKKNLNFGLPLPMSSAGTGVGLPVFAMFLYQNGGAFYTPNGSEALLKSDEAINAFNTWTRFYTDYTLPKQYDFLTQFRSGTIPIGIGDYGLYNSLSVFAPELNGVWEFTLVPGTRKEDGTIDRSVASSVTATVMMNNVKNKTASWEFMKWWTSANTQASYGKELESVMGSAARYATANMEAFYQLPWSSQNFKIMMEQWQWAKGIPEVPGSYMTLRYVDFAFKQVAVTGASDPAKVLMKQTNQINEEIKAKRAEFGLDD